MLDVRSTSGSSLSARSISDLPAASLFNFNVVSAFFLGCLFSVAIQCLCSSSLSKRLLRLCLRRTTPDTRSDVETLHQPHGAGQGEKTFTNTDNDTGVQILLFIMFICFALGSVADLASLTSMTTEGSCAFFVSWGVMAANLGRLVGLIILLVTLHRLKVSHWESVGMMAWLVGLFVLILVNGALNTGTTNSPRNLGLSLCYRKHVLAISIVSSLLFILFELYFVVRFLVVLSPRATSARARVTAELMWDHRLKKAWSLLFLEILSIAPMAVPLKTIDQYIPLVIGTVVVLIAFSASSNSAVHENNIHKRRSSSIRVSEKPPPTPVVVSYPRPPTPPPHPHGRSPSSDNGLQLYRSPSVRTSNSEESVSSANAHSSSVYSPHCSTGPIKRSAFWANPDRAVTSPSGGQDLVLVHPTGRVLSAVPAHLSRQLSRGGGRPKLTVVTNFAPDNPEEGSALATVYTFYSHPISAPEQSHFSLPSASVTSATTAQTSNEDTITELSGGQSFELGNGRRQSAQLTGLSHATTGTFGPPRRMDTPASFRPRGPRLRNP
ncbi:hypothetical protein VNI00_005495 [Paramarasmius palmivorus]|uniref:Pheromone receptor n=1 Tax=Paramarasmius palmivorus TaxID=297713 RepID=A0AAW0DG26_9AGAR